MPLTNNGNVLAQGVGDMWEDAEPTIEFVILAEHAEVIHGKLYLMGGGWENITVHDFEAPVILPLAISILVPWPATNRPHTVELAIQSADAEVLAEQHRHLTVGRPAEIEPGTSQRSMMVLRVPVTLPGPGRYVAIAGINGTPDARVAFRALAAPHAM